jgi:site-specific DNA recombinase
MSGTAEHAPVLLTVPWSKTARSRHRKVIAPEGSGGETLPIRTETRFKLVTAIVRGRLWLSELEAGTANIDDIAAPEGRSKRHVNMTISLAFLAPKLIETAVRGRLPHGAEVSRMCDAPIAWSRQYRVLGLPEPS